MTALPKTARPARSITLVPSEMEVLRRAMDEAMRRIDRLEAELGRLRGEIVAPPVEDADG